MNPEKQPQPNFNLSAEADGGVGKGSGKRDFSHIGEQPDVFLKGVENREVLKEKSNEKDFSAWGLAWELGWQIAIPLVVFALAGRFADRYFDTSPWLLVSGVVLAAILTSILVFRKVSKLIK